MSERSWPELSDELSRKALEAVADHVARHDSGEITTAELILCTQAIYDTIVGIVPMDVADLVYAIRKELSP